MAALLVSVVTSRTAFGRPNIQLSNSRVSCISVDNARGAARVTLNMTVDVYLGKPPTIDDAHTTRVGVYFIYMSQFNPKDPIMFPMVDFSGSNMQYFGSKGGSVTYDRTHPIHYGAVVTQNA